MAASGLFGYMGYDMIRLAENIPDSNPDALGIPEETNYLIEERPFYTTPDGKGKAEMELFG